MPSHAVSHQLRTLILWVGILVLLLLIVVVPVESQTKTPDATQSVEVFQQPPQDWTNALLILLVLQFAFLTVMMISYLMISSNIASKAGLMRDHRRWTQLHFHR